MMETVEKKRQQHIPQNYQYKGLEKHNPEPYKRTHCEPVNTPSFSPPAPKMQRTQESVFAIPNPSPRRNKQIKKGIHIPSTTTSHTTGLLYPHQHEHHLQHHLTPDEIAESMAHQPVLKAAFLKYGTEHIGFIDTKELESIFNDLKWPCDASILQQAIAFMDDYSNGMIDWEGFLKWAEYAWKFQVLKGASELPGSIKGPDGKISSDSLKYVN